MGSVKGILGFDRRVAAALGHDWHTADPLSAHRSGGAKPRPAARVAA